jgi:hypothetical protein
MELSKTNSNHTMARPAPSTSIPNNSHAANEKSMKSIVGYYHKKPLGIS